MTLGLYMGSLHMNKKKIPKAVLVLAMITHFQGCNTFINENATLNTDSSLSPQSPQIKSSCSQTEGQWTKFLQRPGSFTYYVSKSSGNDAYDGLFPDHSKGANHGPKATIAAGISLLRDGTSDWLLLKRGDQWQESLGNWERSGPSSDSPMLVSSFGSSKARPLLQTGTSNGIDFCCSSNGPKNLAIVGLDFFPHTYSGEPDGPTGMLVLGSSDHLLIEDCRFRNYATNITLQNYPGPERHTNFKLRRSIIQDAYSTVGNSQGIYAYGVDGLLIEENIFYHNGWSQAGKGADIYRHNGYIDNGNTDVKYCGNISTDASSHGVQMRSGGSVVNNLFVRNPIAIIIGGGNSPDPGGVLVDMRDNVILDGNDIDSDNARGWAVEFANISSGVVKNTIIANNPLGHQGNGIVINGDHQGDPGTIDNGVHNFHILKNILYNWSGSSGIQGTSTQVSNIFLTQNDFSNDSSLDYIFTNDNHSTLLVTSSSLNRFHSIADLDHWFLDESNPLSLSSWKINIADTSSTSFLPNYSDPNRTVITYNASIGGQATYSDFILNLLEQSKATWDPRYTAGAINNYIRAGFDR